jgi:hypothetical protein
MYVLGKSKCNECEKGERKLIINEDGIFSKCFTCGFTEWEWSWGDNIDYLKYLAERYGIDLKILLEKLESFRI